MKKKKKVDRATLDALRRLREEKYVKLHGVKKKNGVLPKGRGLHEA